MRALSLFRRHLSEVVYGSNDGLVTTFAIVAGVTGAQLERDVVLVIGFASLFADGASMAASDDRRRLITSPPEAGTIARSETPDPVSTDSRRVVAVLVRR